MIAAHTILNYIFFCSYWLIILLVTYKILIKRRAIPSSMAWLLIIYVIPLIGAITYLLFGEYNLGKHRSNRIKIAWNSTMDRIKKLKTYKHIFPTKHSRIAASLFKLCEHRQGIGALKGNKIQLFKQTQDTILSIIKDIELAKNSIDMVFYIWESGGLVDQVITKLITAAKKGIRCRILLDSAGCANFFNSSYPDIMRQSGINIVEALHVNLLRIFLRRMDLRQHRKMILIDDHIAYTGSMNMVDPQIFKQNIGIGQWIDIMVRIDGPVTSAMSIIFSSDWAVETGQYSLFPLLLNPCTNTHKVITGHTIQIIPSGPGYPEGIMHQILLMSLYEARKKLIITTPYLIPSDDLLYAICTAAQRGVEVHIIIPKYNDSILVKWASRAFFSELLNAGVLIHQFQNGLLHVKSVLIDQQISLIGSVNLDIRSLWLNLEITLIIDSKDFSNKLEKIQNNYINLSQKLDPKKWANRPCWERIVERLFYFLSPLL
ncbi:cardiolipin synthase [Candidatus Blochmannia ocreatus (nom. nud.)]|uniref:Cardiolipin synthase A n=1 Tax=Candidatus Blochmannia ocreatus (nom. nud.) TaxID=251538 RepID=A0ABY4SVW5_9ENTR|nr:cardiolipin synthase [Candidatus Blochmannia ocreatus]URJ24931.1 cardiolipin synthase [Candidatus Blochmannia ocreatus]